MNSRSQNLPASHPPSPPPNPIRGLSLENEFDGDLPALTPSPELLARPLTTARVINLSIPLKGDISGSQYSIEPLQEKVRYPGYVDVYREHILGPMPVDTFLERFLPTSPNLAECPDST